MKIPLPSNETERLAALCRYEILDSADGHGFGPHNGARAAREMGDSLTVRSDGTGNGATFTLELPSTSESIMSSNVSVRKRTELPGLTQEVADE